MNVFDAAGEGDLERVRAVVEQDAGSLHATDQYGRTPLFHAADNLETDDGHLEVARYLLDHGVNLTHRDRGGRTALHYACSRRHAGLVLLLLQRGADVSASDDKGDNPLMLAATFGHDDVVRALLEHGGSDVNAANHCGWRVCHLACSCGYSGVLRQLLEAGADPTLRDVLGRTANDLAGGRNRQECITMLQEWHRAYTLCRARSVRDASFVAANFSAPVDAAVAHLVDQSTSGLPMPTVPVSPLQQHGRPSDEVTIVHEAQLHETMTDDLEKLARSWNLTEKDTSSRKGALERAMAAAFGMRTLTEIMDLLHDESRMDEGTKCLKRGNKFIAEEKRASERHQKVIAWRCWMIQHGLLCAACLYY